MVSAVARRSRLIWHSFRCHGRRHWTARRTRAGCGSEHSQRSGLVCHLCHTTAEGHAGEFGDDEGGPAASQTARGRSRSARQAPRALCPKLDWLRSKTINSASIPSMFFFMRAGSINLKIQTPSLELQLQLLPHRSTLAAAGCGSPRATAHSHHSLVTSATSCAGKKTPGSR